MAPGSTWSSPKETPACTSTPTCPGNIFSWYGRRLGLEDAHRRLRRSRPPPCLLYPTAQADFLEYERFYLIKSIEHLIFAGRITVFSIDSINRMAWMNRNVPPRRCRPSARRSTPRYSVEEEVVPHVRRVMQDNPRRCIGVTGASFGAFYCGERSSSAGPTSSTRSSA